MKSEARPLVEDNGFDAARVFEALSSILSDVEVDQDWGTESTIYTFLDDGSRIVLNGSEVCVLDGQAARETLLALVAAYGKAQVEDFIAAWANVTTASIDADGDVWIENPCAGHWLDDDRLITLAEARDGYIWG